MGTIRVIAVTEAQAKMLRGAMASWIEDAGRTATDEKMVQAVRRQLRGDLDATEIYAVTQRAYAFDAGGSKP